MRKFQSALAALAVFPLLAGTVLAAVSFPDVPVTHLHYKAIDELVKAGVINGNPDGTFQPEVSVNRAAFLKMIYKAQGKVPDSSSVRCFPDVVPGSWYEPFVCDAAANKYVNGYPDGTFHPDQAVNRVEALKMIMLAFGMQVDEIDAEEKDVVKFVDVSTAAWYTKYLYTAYVKGILPIPGQEGSRFYPENPLLRGEAAAYIYNALNVELYESRQPSSSSAAASSRSSTATNAASSSDSGIRTVVFPFDTSGKFIGKNPSTYLFTLSEPTTAYTAVTTSTGRVSCRLYLIQDTGFSDEYFLGHEEGTSCYLQTTLNPGSYQLQIQPTVADATFTVSSGVKQGDGNDGFRDAKPLGKQVAITATLDPDDLDDWYTFTVTAQAKMTVDITNALELNCIVYSMKDVDLFGFTGPECGQSYSYPTGTYYVAVSRSIASRKSKKTYTIQLR